MDARNDLHDLIARLKYDVQAKLNITPTWLILDNATYHMLKAAINDMYYPSYQQVNPNEPDKYFGLNISITTGTKPTLEVR